MGTLTEQGINRRAGRWATGAVAAALVAATLSPTAAGARPGEVLAENLDGPRGVAMGPQGRMAFTEANGVFSHVVRKGSNIGKIVRLGRVPEQFVAPALSINKAGKAYVLTAGQGKGGAGRLFMWRPNTKKKELVANVGAYQRRDPDPFDLEGHPKESNPFGVAALSGGAALVADAAGNDLLHVTDSGQITTVARFKPRKVRVPKGLGRQAPPAGSKMRSESVPTAVTVGADGYWYVGELRGYPATPGTSAIWRIKPGAKNAVCNPKKPRKGPCKKYADGYTSIMAMDGAADGSLVVVEMSKKGWLKAEMGRNGAEIGRLSRLSADRSGRVELMPGELVMPGGVEAGRGKVYVTTPVFGPGSVVKAK